VISDQGCPIAERSWVLGAQFDEFVFDEGGLGEVEFVGDAGEAPALGRKANEA